MSSEEKVVFNQPNWDVRGDVYNTAGDLILSKTSTKEDLSKALLEVKEELSKLADIPDADCKELQQEVAEAAAEAQAPSPPKDQITSRLERIKQRLAGLDGVASGALALGKTVAAIAVWVATFL